MLQHLVIFFAQFLSLVNGGSFTGSVTNLKVEAVEVRSSSPLFGETFYRVFRTDSFVMYQSQYDFDSTKYKMRFDSSINQMVQETVYQKEERRNHFFVFHKDGAFGYMYNPIDKAGGDRRMSVDTILANIKGTNNFEQIENSKADTSEWNSEKSLLKEVYVYKGNKDTPTIRLSLYFSSGLNHLKESLNPVLDKARQMKLYKTEILIDSFYSEKDKRQRPSILDSTEMVEIKAENADELIYYIDRYKQSVGPQQQSERN